MNITEIKAAVDAGKKVQWNNHSYEVIKDKNGAYLIKHAYSQSCTGLTNLAGDKLNGEESEFSIVPINGYKAFYKNKQTEIYAYSSYEAQKLAAVHFKAKKEHEITVVLCEKGGEQVEHTADF